MDDNYDLILKTTRIPEWKERVFNDNALFLWSYARQQEELALSRMLAKKLVKTSRGRKA